MAASIVTEILIFPATHLESQKMVRPFLDFQASAKAEKDEMRPGFQGKRLKRTLTHPATEERKRKRNHTLRATEVLEKKRKKIL